MGKRNYKPEKTFSKLCEVYVLQSQGTTIENWSTQEP